MVTSHTTIPAAPRVTGGIILGMLYLPCFLPTTAAAQELKLAHRFHLIEDQWAGRVQFSSDSKSLYAQSSALTIKGWNLETKKEVFFLERPAGGRAFVLFPDGRRLMTTNYTMKFNGPPGSQRNIVIGEFRLWDTSTSRALKIIPAGRGLHLAIDIAPDGRSFVASGDDNTVKIRDMTTGRCLQTLLPRIDLDGERPAKVWTVLFAPDGKWLLTASTTVMQRWDLKTGKAASIEAPDLGSFGNVTLSSDGKWLAASVSRTVLVGKDDGAESRTGNVRVKTERGAWVWDAATGKVKAKLVYGNECRNVLFHPDGRHLLTTNNLRTHEGYRHEVVCWDFLKERRLATWIMSAQVGDVALSPDGQWLATCHNDGGTVRVWRLPPLGGTKR